MEKQFYNIYFTNCDGTREYVATTNDFIKWLENNNKERLNDQEETETKDDFSLEEANVKIYN